MATLTTKEIIEATGGELLSQDSNSFGGVSIDSRTIHASEIFFALRGQRFDGHDFLDEVLLKGNGAVVDARLHSLPGTLSVPKGKVLVYVKDTLRALQDLAYFLRMKRDIPAVAITGSNGKTTTKEMTYKILSTRFKVFKNEGNLNNQIGLPLSLTGLTPDDEVIVLELGMNAPGEIRRLCEIAVPSHAVITNIGSAHIGELGSLDSIRSAKLEILQGLAVAVLNADDSFLMEGIEGFGGRIITFSVNNDSHVRAENVSATGNGSTFTLSLKSGERVVITLNIHGLFNVYNALAASAVCLSLGITAEEIKTALESYAGFPVRFQVIRGDKITLINDFYNANPSSMKESLKEFVLMKGEKRTVAVLGDMMELGKFSEEAHRAAGKMISEIGVDVFVAVGEMMSLAAEESKKIRCKKSMPAIYTFINADEAREDIVDILKRGDTVLIKGSRLMCMEKIAERIDIL